MVSLDADTGIADKNFGVNGIVDLTIGMRTSDTQELDVGSTSPPLVINDVIVVGSAHKAALRPYPRQMSKEMFEDMTPTVETYSGP